ncbi:glycosyltransferase family 22 protein [Phlebiopsis gigantea 11061_1 CR5-6]|uniref:Mannosyltransferase n=1 Tax=Phlebiopsis gigantea (strain 11061_1 CR5-6) TaxID=745531 RepID=A0A0C3PWA4_PHLG1|nr:glycosyltransferase family 22 protein [Phlebiopsis gigantea 11061_1 CR5-6]
MNLRTLLTVVSVRICIALVTQTFFQPDEYFQSLEVAHHLVFGYGHLTWEWLSDKPIRSILYPGLNVPIYYALKWLELDDTKLLIWGPKVLHGALASLTDICVCALTEKLLGRSYANVALFLSLTSLFNGLSLTRSMSNSLETSLTTLALSVFPWSNASRKAFRSSLWVAAIACAIRPTNAVIWSYVVTAYLWRLRSNTQLLFYSAVDLCVIGLFSISTLSGIDSLYYGKFTLTPLNFVLTNLSSVSLFYGASPWHYYLTQGLPILCTAALPFALHGMWISASAQGTSTLKWLLGLIVWTIGIYSLAGHKEWRFIHPLLPLLHIFASKSLVDLYQGSASYHAQKGDSKKLPTFPIRAPHLVLLFLNIPALVYLATCHSRAQVDITHYFRSLSEGEVRSAGFLMPCHSTPWHAYFHKPSWSDGHRFWALGCEPPLGGETIRDYKDQTDVFYDSPIRYLQDRFPAAVNPQFPPSPKPYSKPGEATRDITHDWQHEWPEYIVVFGALLHEPGVDGLLKNLGFRVAWKDEYGWEGDARRREGIVVLKYM